MRPSLLAALVSLALPAPASALAALTFPPNASSFCFVFNGGSSAIEENAAVLQTTPAGDEIDATLTATADDGYSNPLYLDSFAYECALLATGTLGYGSASGNLSLTTASTPDFLPPAPGNEPNIFTNSGRASGVGLLKMQFDDSGVVTSSTLPNGTPVTLSFPLSLDSSVILTGRPPSPLLAAEAVYEVRATDIGPTLPTGAFLDFLEGTVAKTLTLNTFVGNTINLQAILTLQANALAGREMGQSDYNAQADVLIDASHTALYTIDPPDGVGFDSESGHDYTAAPEPAQALELAAAALMLQGVSYVRCRRRARTSRGG